MLKRFLTLLLPLFVLAGCNQYEKLLKSTDYGKKYDMALLYYEEEKYDKAYPLLEELAGLFRGTEKAEKIYFYYAWTNYHLGDFIMAGYHFKNFARTYPNSVHAEEALYMNAYCNYLNSPEYSLDQSATYAAISEFQLFIDRYPLSEKVKDANEMIDKLRGKLERKAYERAKLFYKTENYQSAIVAVNNMLRDFPGTSHAEELSFIALSSHYLYALNSIENKKQERIEATIEYYNKFHNRFPESEYRREAESIRIDATRLKETVAFSVAGTYYKRGFYKDASSAFKKAVEGFPESPEVENAAYMMVNSLYQLGEKSEGFVKLDAYSEVPVAYEMALPYIKTESIKRSLQNIVERSAERQAYWQRELPFWFSDHRMYENAIKAAKNSKAKDLNTAELEEMVLENWLALAGSNLQERERALKGYRDFKATATLVNAEDLAKLDKKYSRIFVEAPKVVKTFYGRKEYDTASGRARIYLADKELSEQHNEIRLLLLKSIGKQILKEKDPARAIKRWEVNEKEFRRELASLSGKEREKADELLEDIVEKVNSNK